MKKILCGSLVLSIIMSILFWHKSPGISVIIFIIPLILLILYSLRENQKIKNKNGIYWSIPIILLSLTYFIFNNILFQLLNVPIIIGLIIIMCMDITETQISENRFIRNIISKVFKPFSNFKSVLKILKLKEKIEEQKETQNDKIIFCKKINKINNYINTTYNNCNFIIIFSR